MKFLQFVRKKKKKHYCKLSSHNGITCCHPEEKWLRKGRSLQSYQCCRKGDLFQGLRVSSYLTLGNELFKEAHMLTKLKTLLGRGAQGREPRRTVLPLGSKFLFFLGGNAVSFWVVSSPSSCLVHTWSGSGFFLVTHIPPAPRLSSPLLSAPPRFSVHLQGNTMLLLWPPVVRQLMRGAIIVPGQGRPSQWSPNTSACTGP